MKKSLLRLAIIIGSIVGTINSYSQQGGDDIDWHAILAPEISSRISVNCLGHGSQNCNQIENNSFTPDPSYFNPYTTQNYQNPFHLGFVPEWLPACGSANIYDGLFYNQQPPSGINGWAGLYAGYDNSGQQIFCEGIAKKIPSLVAGREYNLSFFKKRFALAPSMDHMVQNFTILLMNCADYSLLTPSSYELPPLSSFNHEVIYCEKNVSNTNWRQVITSFVPNSDWDMILIYVNQNLPPSQGDGDSYLLVSFPELIDFSNGITAGDSPVPGNCNITIGPDPLNCSFANAQFTWTDPNNAVIYQGPNQNLNLNMANAVPGNYTLTMSYPGAFLIPSNTCNSTSPPILSSQVNVPPPLCNCTGLQIINPTFDYELDALPPMSLSTCSENKLCNFLLYGDDIFHFTGMSNQANGNIWQIRKYNGPLYPNSNGIEINGMIINYPASENFTTYSTNISGDFDLFTMAGNDCNFEIKLINTITNTSQIIYVNIFAHGGVVSQGNFFCVSSGNSVCPIPHKLIAGYNQPGYSYQWTLPTGMNPCSSLTNAWITWDDANFDYNDPNHPPLVASLLTTNIFGCPSTVSNINIDPSVCNMNRQNNDILEKKTAKEIKSPFTESGNTATIFPNPAKESFRINTNELCKTVVIQASDGRTLITRTNVKPKEEIFITGLRAGLYIVTIYKIDGKRSIYKLIKQ